MPGGGNIVLFLTASLVVIVAPGPDNILVPTPGVPAWDAGRRWSRRRVQRRLGYPLALRGRRPLGAPGTVVGGLLGGQVCGGGVPDLPRPQGAARPGASSFPGARPPSGSEASSSRP